MPLHAGPTASPGPGMPGAPMVTVSGSAYDGPLTNCQLKLSKTSDSNLSNTGTCCACCMWPDFTADLHE